MMIIYICYMEYLANFGYEISNNSGRYWKNDFWTQNTFSEQIS